MEIWLYFLQNNFKNADSIILVGDRYEANVYNPEKCKTNWLDPFTHYIPENCTVYRIHTYRFGQQYSYSTVNSIA